MGSAAEWRMCGGDRAGHAVGSGAIRAGVEAAGGKCVVAHGGTIQPIGGCIAGRAGGIAVSGDWWRCGGRASSRTNDSRGRTATSVERVWADGDKDVCGG